MIEPGARKIICTDFENQIVSSVDVPPFPGSGTDKARFMMKVLHFLSQYENHSTILKLRQNEQLSLQDIAELERIFLDEGVGRSDDLDFVRDEGGLGLFIRSLVGLDREAAKFAMSESIDGRALTANQIGFTNLIIDYLTELGVMDPRRLYDSPFTDIDDQGINGVFPAVDVKLILEVLEAVREKVAV